MSNHQYGKLLTNVCCPLTSN